MELIHNSLERKIEMLKAQIAKQAPAEALNAFAREVTKVANSKIVQRAKQRGEFAPFFTLPNAINKKVSLSSYLEKGMVVLVWYRGGWCPYCNTMLHELQLYIDLIKAAGANLIAISPESPDHSLSTSEKHELTFEVLSDHNNDVAKQYGIAFTTGEVTRQFIASQRPITSSDAELPLAATYIIDKDGLIRYAFLEADYKRRSEPYDIITTLQNIAKLS